MKNNIRINYNEIELPKELLNSFAKALLPEIRKFYDSEEGKKYYQKWILKHPEYNTENPDAHASGF